MPSWHSGAFGYSARDESGISTDSVGDHDGDLALGYDYDHGVLTSGLIGWWPLAWTDAHDLSGNNNHGTLNGGVKPGVAGRGGLEAMAFDGASGYVHASDVSGDLKTLAVWYRGPVVDGSKSYRMPFNDASDSDRYLVFGNYTSGFGGETVSINDPASRDTVTYITDSLAANKWHFIVLRWNGSDYDFIVDGTTRATKSGSDGHAGLWNASGLDLGARGTTTGDGYLRGTLFSPRVYGVALTDSQLQTLYELGSADLARPPMDGISRYPLDGDATDVWGSNDATNNGVTFTSDAIRGQAGVFDGSGAHLETGFTVDPAADYKFAFAAWIKPDSANSGNYNCVLADTQGNLNEGDVGALMYVDPDGAYDFRIYNGSTSSIDTQLVTGSVKYDEWVHVAFVGDGSMAAVYENGRLLAKETNVNPSGNSSETTLEIGRKPIGQSKLPFQGEMDDVRIFDQYLSPPQLVETYRWGTGGVDMTQQTVIA